MIIDDIRNVSQSGKPKVKVKIRCLDNLNEYGIKPAKLIKIINENREEIIDDLPFTKNANVRDSWSLIIDFMVIIGAFVRLKDIQNVIWIVNTRNIFISINIDDDL